MNDFTKEELHELMLGLSCRFSQKLGVWDGKKLEETRLLELKIEEMIENYCEHSESQADHNYEVERCNKCGRLFI